MKGSGLRIIHPTDFSETSHRAFAHALKLALASKGELFLLHLEASKPDSPHWEDFPGVRETLERWGLLEPGADRRSVFDKLGIEVAKFDVIDRDIAHGVAEFTGKYGGDIIVLGTEGRSGFARLFQSSRAEQILRSVNIASLFVPAQANGFVDPDSGDAHIRNVVVPVDHAPNPQRAVHEIGRIVAPLGVAPSDLSLVHVGDEPPDVVLDRSGAPADIACHDGNVVDAVLDVARDANLIALATEGHHGILDALRGSTSEQIVRRAHCPVLAIPVR